jgi:hypothetical protein
MRICDISLGALVVKYVMTFRVSPDSLQQRRETLVIVDKIGPIAHRAAAPEGTTSFEYFRKFELGVLTPLEDEHYSMGLAACASE